MSRLITATLASKPSRRFEFRFSGSKARCSIVQLFPPAWWFACLLVMGVATRGDAAERPETTFCGTILNPDNTPAVGTTVILSLRSKVLSLMDPPAKTGDAIAETDATGVFSLKFQMPRKPEDPGLSHIRGSWWFSDLRRSTGTTQPAASDDVPPPPAAPAGLCAMAFNKHGIAAISRAELLSSPTVLLKPWARIEGTVRVDHDQPPIKLLWRSGSDSGSHLAAQTYAKVDRSGHFAFECVPPGRVRLSASEHYRCGWVGYLDLILQLQPGENRILDRQGTTVIGTIRFTTTSLMHGEGLYGAVTLARSPNPAKPPVVDPCACKREKYDATWDDWWHTAEANEDGIVDFTASRVPGGLLQPHPDVEGDNGSFRIDGVPPGRYTLDYTVYVKNVECDQLPNPRIDVRLHDLNLGDDSNNRVVDLKTMVVRQLPVGARAPDFSFQTADGQRHRLSQFAGKRVLLRFWCRGNHVPDTIPMERRWNDVEFLNLGLPDGPTSTCRCSGKWTERWTDGRVLDDPDRLRTTYQFSYGPAWYAITPDQRIAGMLPGSPYADLDWLLSEVGEGEDSKE